MTPAPRKSLEPFLRDDVDYYKHQTEAIRKIAALTDPGHILADDMGLGKSLQALTVFCIKVKQGIAESCIIVCPTTLRGNWADEIEKFTRIPYVRLGEEPHPNHPSRLRKLVVKKREMQLQDWLRAPGPKILICNYEQLASEHHSATLKRARIDVGIYDEAHYIKNPRSNRAKASLNLNTKFSMLLTGTPMQNRVDELWSLLHKSNPAKFPKYWSFVNRYCVFGGYNDQQIIGTKNTAELKSALASHMTRRLKRHTLKLGEPNYVRVAVGLSDLQQEMYDTASDELLLEIPGATIPPSEIANAMVKFTRLLQICDTPYCIDPSFPDDSEKLDRAIEMLEEFVVKRGERVAVFTQFRGVVAALQSRLDAAKIGPRYSLTGSVPPDQRVGVVKDWSVGDPGVILCMSQVAGVGLNMVAGSTMLRMDRLFVPGLNNQVVDRMNRIGQNNPVQVFDLVCRKTVEDKVYRILQGKIKLNEDIVEGSAGQAKLLEKLKQQLAEQDD